MLQALVYHKTSIVNAVMFFSSGERCKWVETVDRTSHDFTTCVPNMYCTDGICDALEARDPSICPQDCAQFTGRDLFYIKVRGCLFYLSKDLAEAGPT